MKYLISISLVVLVLGGVFVWSGLLPEEWRSRTEPEPAVNEVRPVGPYPDRVPEEDEDTVPFPPGSELPETMIQTVPFTPQAPRGQWSDLLFQNACEEASLIMAAAWAESASTLVPAAEIEEEIRAISALAEKRFGAKSYDTSAEDTATLYREYFRSEGISVLHDLTLDGLRDILRGGNIVVAPFDGRKLGNPHYTRPGPAYHMLVIIGYDAETRDFVTNDPGTRFGASYRYAEQVLFDAISDYPTGFHVPRTSQPAKSALAISPAAATTKMAPDGP